MNRVSEKALVGWMGAALGLTAVAGCNIDRPLTAEERERYKMPKLASSSGGGGGAKEAKAGETKAAEPAFNPAELKYQEIPVGTRLAVVGTAKGAEQVLKSGKPAHYVSEIGYGKDGQTVWFENKPEGIEKALKAEFAKRHGIK